MDWGTMEAVVNKLGGIEGVERFLRNWTAVTDNTGTPANENLLENGAVYFVENFSFTSWGYLAQLKKAGKNVLVSKQFRVTSTRNLVPGTCYMVQIQNDRNSALGVRAFFVEVPPSSQ